MAKKFKDNPDYNEGDFSDQEISPHSSEEMPNEIRPDNEDEGDIGTRDYHNYAGDEFDEEDV